MSVNTSVSLDDHFAGFIASQVGSGRYRSASEVIRAGLRLLEDQETEMSALREALASGEASGQAEPFDFDAFIAAKAARTSRAPTVLAHGFWEVRMSRPPKTPVGRVCQMGELPLRPVGEERPGHCGGCRRRLGALHEGGALLEEGRGCFG